MSDELPPTALPPIEIPEWLKAIGPMAREWIKDADTVEGVRRAEKWLAELAAQVTTIRGMRNARLHTLRRTMTVRQVEDLTGINKSTITKL